MDWAKCGGRVFGLVCILILYAALFSSMYFTVSRIVAPWIGLKGLTKEILISMVAGLTALTFASHIRASRSTPGVLFRMKSDKDKNGQSDKGKSAKSSTPESSSAEESNGKRTTRRTKAQEKAMASPEGENSRGSESSLPSGDASPKADSSRGEVKCTRCGVIRPNWARAHHCRQCGVCVLRMDHHCPWISNCVGLANHRFFIQLLAYGALVSAVFMSVFLARLYTCPSILGGLMYMSENFEQFAIQSNKRGLLVNDASCQFDLSYVILGITTFASSFAFGTFCVFMLMDQLMAVGKDYSGIELASVDAFCCASRYVEKRNPKATFWSNLELLFGCKFGLAWFLPISVRHATITQFIMSHNDSREPSKDKTE